MNKGKHICWHKASQNYSQSAFWIEHSKLYMRSHRIASGLSTISEKRKVKESFIITMCGSNRCKVFWINFTFLISISCVNESRSWFDWPWFNAIERTHGTSSGILLQSLYFQALLEIRPCGLKRNAEANKYKNREETLLSRIVVFSLTWNIR